MIGRKLGLIVAGFLCLAGAARADCADTHVHLRWDGGQARFGVEVADTPEKRNRGLMYREELGRFQGMLFVYPQPDRVVFWMKNTPIPLDLIFMDQSGSVVKIHPDAVPYDLTNIPGGEAIQYVLEINGGLANALGLKAGAQLRHPAIEAGQAAWSCEESG